MTVVKDLDWVNAVVQKVYGPYILDHVAQDLKEWIDPAWGPAETIQRMSLYVDTLIHLTRRHATAEICRGQNA